MRKVNICQLVWNHTTPQMYTFDGHLELNRSSIRYAASVCREQLLECQTSSNQIDRPYSTPPHRQCLQRATFKRPKVNMHRFSTQCDLKNYKKRKGESSDYYELLVNYSVHILKRVAHGEMSQTKTTTGTPQWGKIRIRIRVKIRVRIRIRINFKKSSTDLDKLILKVKSLELRYRLRK